MSRAKQYAQSLGLTLLFAFMVFIIMLMTMALILLGALIMTHFELLEEKQLPRLPLFMFAVVSIIVGTVIAMIISRKPLAPLTDVMDAVDKVTKGDYSVRVQPRGTAQFQQLGEKFNRMTEELDSVEIMRSDFINNFSHEFKTPIVSIRGFAKALKWDDLREEERTEYLDIIIGESERLSDLSTNVLYLSKIERQNILTNKSSFNLCEQIRRAVALLDHKLAAKQLELEFEGEDTIVTGNEDMLRQVWINLLDNAIKFSPEKGAIKINVVENQDYIQVAISDQGIGMSEKSMEHIFDMFYQGDGSHNMSGNGLGLTIVKRIVDLHGGKINISSSDRGSVFTILFNTK